MAQSDTAITVLDSLCDAFPCGLEAKNEEWRSRNRAKNDASKRAGTERHRSLGPRAIFFFFWTPPCGAERHRSLGPRPVFFFPNATARQSDTIDKEIDFLSSVEISRHHVVHWAKLLNWSLKPGSSFQKESHVTWRHRDTKAEDFI